MRQTAHLGFLVCQMGISDTDPRRIRRGKTFPALCTTAGRQPESRLLVVFFRLLYAPASGHRFRRVLQEEHPHSWARGALAPPTEGPADLLG